MNDAVLNVLIVDDSRIFRGAVAEALSRIEQVRVAGSVWSGEKAVEAASAVLPDLVTLDVEMPGQGGLKTLQQLKSLAAAAGRQIGVLLISSHCQRGAAVTMEGLQEGAFDFILKPQGASERENIDFLVKELTPRIRAWRSRGSGTRWMAVDRPGLDRPSAVPGRTRFRALLVAASTGGPEALVRVLPALARECPVPIFLVQHFPADFTEHFRESLARRTQCQLVTAEDGNICRPGVVYLAPGGRHLTLQRRDGLLYTVLSDEPPACGCRPAADVLFQSAAALLGRAALVLVLTGMGRDGAVGARQLHDAGAWVIAQNEATSVVWGMPGSTVAAGAADQVLALDEIGPTVRSLLGMQATC